MSNIVRVKFSSEEIKMLKLLADGTCDVILKVSKERVERNCMSDIVRVKLSSEQIKWLNIVEGGCYNLILKVAEEDIEGISEVLEVDKKVQELSSPCPTFDLGASISFAKNFMRSPGYSEYNWALGRIKKGDFSGRDPLGNYDPKVAKQIRYILFYQPKENQRRREENRSLLWY